MTLDELKETKIWFPWRYVLGKNGKMTKIPMSAKGGVTGSSDNYRDTWEDYEAALEAKEKYNASGIGFVVPDNMYFLDIDGRSLDDSFVQLLLERHDTYAEISPSGNGIHILGTCDNDSLPFVWDEAKGRVSLDLVKRYTEVPELTAEIIREFIEKVYVYHPEKINGQRTQRVRIVWNCIGEIPTQNKTA